MRVILPLSRRNPREGIGTWIRWCLEKSWRSTRERGPSPQHHRASAAPIFRLVCRSFRVQTHYTGPAERPHCPRVKTLFGRGGVGIPRRGAHHSTASGNSDPSGESLAPVSAGRHWAEGDPGGPALRACPSIHRCESPSKRATKRFESGRKARRAVRSARGPDPPPLVNFGLNLSDLRWLLGAPWTEEGKGVGSKRSGPSPCSRGIGLRPTGRME